MSVASGPISPEQAPEAGDLIWVDFDP